MTYPAWVHHATAYGKHQRCSSCGSLSDRGFWLCWTSPLTVGLVVCDSCAPKPKAS